MFVLSKRELKGCGQLSVLKKIQFKVDSNLQALESLLSQFNRIYDDFIPNQDWLKCKLALAEGFTNAVRHAHKQLPTEIQITIEAVLKPTTLEIYIWDLGNPFDLNQYIQDKSKNNNNWLGSGRGVAILTQIADRLEYRHIEKKGNCLLIVKEFSQRIGNGD